MKIIIDTTADDFDDAVRTLYTAFGYDPDEENTDSGDVEQESATKTQGSNVLPGGWTELKLRKWANLLTDDAQEIVRYVAEHAPEVGWDDVADHLGKVKGLGGPAAGNVIGGAMSSGGHARKKLRGAPKTQPLDRDYGQRVYVMDERVATILADELGAAADV